MKTIKNTLFILLSFLFLLIPLTTKAIDVSNMEIVQNGNQLEVKQINSVEKLEQTRDYQKEYMEDRYNRYIKVITFITAIATITMLGIFIMHIIKFAATGTEHWIIRRNAMFGMLWSGIATGLLGSATLIMGLAFNVFSW